MILYLSISERAAKEDTRADYCKSHAQRGHGAGCGLDYFGRAIFSLTFNLTKTLVFTSDASLVSRFGRI